MAKKRLRRRPAWKFPVSLDISPGAARSPTTLTRKITASVTIPKGS